MIVTHTHRERERERERMGEGRDTVRGRSREGKAGSMHREPDMGLDPRSPGSCPGPKAGAKPLRHPGIPIHSFLTDTHTHRERERERGRDTGKGRIRLHAGSPMWDWIPGLQDHALGRREVFNHLVV